jgi:hypothetical protein
MRNHDLHTTYTKTGVELFYFYQNEKRDINGNARFRVFVIAPDSGIVFERIVKCYEFEIPNRVASFVENYKGGESE